jgi:hypothetical protein
MVNKVLRYILLNEIKMTSGLSVKSSLCQESGCDVLRKANQMVVCRQLGRVVFFINHTNLVPDGLPRYKVEGLGTKKFKFTTE